MTDTAAGTRAVVVEREMPFPPEKIWRALTQARLIDEWLMPTDFEPVPGHRFRLTADWGGVEGQVRTVDPYRTLSYSWDTKDLESVVTGPSPQPTPAPASAWSRQASGATRSPTTAAPRPAGRGFSRASSRF